MAELKTEGQRLICEVEGTERALATKIGCGKSMVGHWRRGERMPSDEQKHRLELLFGIPRRAWDVAPGTDLTHITEWRDPTKPKEPKEPSKQNGQNKQPVTDTLGITKAQVQAIVESLDNPGLTDASKAKLRDTLAKVLALQSRLERDQELREDRYVREHPRWVALKQRIVRALEPYPQATKAVLEAILEELK